MAEIKNKTYALSQEKSDSLVIHCSDPRFQNAFRAFAVGELGLKVYDSLVIPGASQLLMFSDLLPKFSTAFMRSLKFLVKEHSLKRIFIITHEDCAWYGRFVPIFLAVKGSVKDQQISDLYSTKHLLEEEFAGVSVRIFYAAINQAKEAEFSEITEKQ
jgi:hypothetical protein